MAQITLPNIVTGKTITVEAPSLQAAQQKAAEATGVSLAAQQAGGTYGGDSFNGGAPSGGGGSGVVPATVGETANIDALRNFFGQTAGFSREELAERARQFDLSLAQQEKQWERDGLPRLEIDQRSQALREWQAQQDIRLQEQSLGLQRGQLGLQYLTTASQMGGPADVFQQADFLRGARQRGDVPGFLGDLANNTQAPAFTGAGNASILPQTAGGLTLQLGGGAVTIPTTPSAPTQYTPEQLMQVQKQMEGQLGQAGWAQYAFENALKQGMNVQDAIKAGAQGRQYTAPTLPTVPPAVQMPATSNNLTPGGYDTDAALAQVGSIFKAGPTSLSPGSLERLDPNELAILKSGATKLGYDPDAWLRAYSKAGVGQAAGSAF